MKAKEYREKKKDDQEFVQKNEGEKLNGIIKIKVK